jgi:hypothetical protein
MAGERARDPAFNLVTRNLGKVDISNGQETETAGKTDSYPVPA